MNKTKFLNDMILNLTSTPHNIGALHLINSVYMMSSSNKMWCNPVLEFVKCCFDGTIMEISRR